MFLAIHSIKKYSSQTIKNFQFVYINCTNYAKMSSATAKVPDNRLETFCNVCDEIGEERSYLNKADILQKFLQKGVDKNGFKGDTLLWIRMLIPGSTQRVYNLQNKQMLKLFSRIFGCDNQEMHLDLEQGWLADFF